MRCGVCQNDIASQERHNGEMCAQARINTALERAANVADEHGSPTVVGQIIRSFKVYNLPQQPQRA